MDEENKICREIGIKKIPPRKIRRKEILKTEHSERIKKIFQLRSLSKPLTPCHKKSSQRFESSDNHLVTHIKLIVCDYFHLTQTRVSNRLYYRTVGKVCTLPA